jgi:hypothetical protein
MTVILSRRSRVAEGRAAQDGRRTPSLLTRLGGGKSRGKHVRGPSTVPSLRSGQALRRYSFASAPAAAQDDSGSRQCR